MREINLYALKADINFISLFIKLKLIYMTVTIQKLYDLMISVINLIVDRGSIFIYLFIGILIFSFFVWLFDSFVFKD